MSTLSEQLSDAVQNARNVPREMAEKLLTDVAGLCVAARRTDYVRASLAGWEASGGCTAIGHSRTLDAAGAPLLKGTSAPRGGLHGTFQGGPGHARAGGGPPGLPRPRPRGPGRGGRPPRLPGGGG